MEKQLLSCTLCGHKFTEGDESVCGQCPLHKGCQLTCCPNCGFSNIHFSENTKRSVLANRINKSNTPLNNIKKGELTFVHSISKKMPPQKQAYLQARGIRPGKYIRVLQKKPTVIVEIDQMCVAIEDDFAKMIYVN